MDNNIVAERRKEEASQWRYLLNREYKFMIAILMSTYLMN